MSRALSPHSFLTALSPIEHRAGDPDGRLRAVRDALHAHRQLESPFRDCPMAHMVRLQVLDTLRPAMGDYTAPPLQSSYLLFVAELDGGIDDFLDCLYRVDPDFVARLWGRCEGYPRYAGAVFFRQYVRRCLIADPLPYAAFATTVPEVLRLLARKESLADWVADANALDDAALQKAWHAQRRALLQPKLPRPGAL